MTTLEELMEELESESVHVGHGKHGDDLVTGFHGIYCPHGEHVVAYKGSIGEHDPLGETGGP